MPYSVHKNCGINITEICFKSERGLSFIVTSRNRTSKCKIFKVMFEQIILCILNIAMGHGSPITTTSVLDFSEWCSTILLALVALG